VSSHGDSGVLTGVNAFPAGLTGVNPVGGVEGDFPVRSGPCH